MFEMNAGGGPPGRFGFDMDEDKKKVNGEVVQKFACFFLLIGFLRISPWILKKTNIFS